ncbi:MAG: energy transducer TonB [Flavobacteriales bacterium]|nr:energy transducer TonB [Flavobacteriales bacterium]
MKTLSFLNLFFLLLITTFSFSNIIETEDPKPHDEDKKKNKYASFPGGDSALACYILNNISYPERAVDLNLIGTIHLKLEIDENGRIVQAEPDKKLLPEIHNQIETLIKKMPDWNPGIRNGKPFKSKVLVPIQFQIK